MNPLTTLRLRGEGDGAQDALVPAVPVPQPAGVPAGHALTRQDGGRMGVLEQAVTVIRHAFRVARGRGRDLSRREGGWVHALLTGKPPSVSEQREYLRTRAWLPPGHEGGIADKAGAVYHRVIGIPGVAFGNWVSATCSRPFRFAGTLAALAALTLLILLLT